MIRKSEYFEQADKFLNSELNANELKEFEFLLEVNSDLAGEVNLQTDVELAVCEQDIISLRNNLCQIVQNQTDPVSNQISVFDAFSFGLSEEFSSKKLSAKINTGDGFNFGHTFPQIHLYQHKVAGKENIHQFYREQSESESSAEESTFSALDEDLFIDVQNALEENDIADLRANLNQIAKTITAHQYSSEEIEDYMHGRMDQMERDLFDQEMAVNPALAQDVRLFSDIDIALAESDIINLRASLAEIQKRDFIAPVGIQEIENYIHGDLSDQDMARFEDELSSNTRLAQEIDLIKNIDMALCENDVMQLRGNLQSIAQQIASEKRAERSLAGGFRGKKALLISSVAASLILLLGITGLLSRHSSQQEIYQKFYSRYESAGVVRSAATTTDMTMAYAMQKFDNQQYNEALELFGQVIEKDQNCMAGHFYSGIAFQETGRYLNAIREYETVIIDKDNLFTEQAQWYIALCFIQTNDNKKAYKQFKKIAENQGFYQSKAQEILKKLKNTDN